jgi:hypothetical protein
MNQWAGTGIDQWAGTGIDQCTHKMDAAGVCAVLMPASRQCGMTFWKTNVKVTG